MARLIELRDLELQLNFYRGGRCAFVHNPKIRSTKKNAYNLTLDRIVSRGLNVSQLKGMKRIRVRDLTAEEAHNYVALEAKKVYTAMVETYGGVLPKRLGGQV